MVYRARRDGWVAAMAVPAMFLMIGGGAWLFYTGVDFVSAPSMIVFQFHRPPHEFMVGLILIVFGFMFLWSVFSARYELCGPSLVVSSGPDRQLVPLGNILEVAPNHNLMRCGWLRRPVWSFKLLCITHRGPGDRAASKLAIAPVDEAAFLRALLDAAPHLRLDQENGLLQASASPVDASEA